MKPGPFESYKSDDSASNHSTFLKKPWYQKGWENGEKNQCLNKLKIRAFLIKMAVVIGTCLNSMKTYLLDKSSTYYSGI